MNRWSWDAAASAVVGCAVGPGITVDGRLVVREDQVLDPDGIRGHPGLLGSARIIDSTINVGDQLLADPPSATGFALLDGAGTLARILR